MSIADIQAASRSIRSLAHFSPHLRIFTHTCGLDHRLWDSNQKLKPEVRSYIMSSITKMWSKEYKQWAKWSRVYFAGSEASEWTSDTLEGNNDFDVLIGVDYDKFRKANPEYSEWTDGEITGKMNPQFRQYNGSVMIKVDGVEYGPWDRTTYVNPDSYSIKKIKPYAAYDVGANKWIVKPPHLPHWGLDKLDPAVRKVLRASDALARSVLKLPEPERTQQGAALFDAWHTDRSRAFSANGEGWFDIANLREKWNDQSGVWAQLVECKHRFDAGLGAAPKDWSNTPKTAAKMLRPSELATYHGRDDLDHPWNRHKIDDLKQSIIEHGYDGRGDPIRVGYDPDKGPTLTNGNKRIKALTELGYDAPLPVHKTAMPWFDTGEVKRPRPKSVRRAGFAGFAAEHKWLKDFGHNGNEADQPDHTDEHLGHFITHHSPHPSTWTEPGGEPGSYKTHNVDLTKPIFATQSHVSQHHIDRYRKNPKDTSWAMKDDEDAHDDYPGHYNPMFVTHQGRTHVIEGHHRVAAALQRGETSIKGLHYNLDENPVVKNHVGHDCPTCERQGSTSHATQQMADLLGVDNPFKRPQSEPERRTASSVGTDYPLPTVVGSRAPQLHGKGLNALFPVDEDGPAPTAGAPWPSASQSKTRKTYDEGLVARSITHPEDFKTEDVDPRMLRATQPKVLRGGVKHYMEGGVDYGKQNGGDHRLGNDVPRIYHRIDDDQHIILSGHHRAAAALLKGEPLHAMVLHGGWGADRKTQ